MSAVAVAAAMALAAPHAAAAQPTVVWAVGDGADGSRQAQQVAGLIRRDHPARFLYLGDVYEDGTAADFRDHYSPVYGSLNPITAPTPGNHEWAHRSTGYYPYWRQAKGRRIAPWYRFSLAGWEIMSLNSEAAHRGGSPQQRWLRRAVRRHSGTCRIAFMHRPYRSAGVHGDDSSLGSLWRTLRRHGRLVLSGHEHDMQRLRRRDGLTQYVSGAGGRERHPLHHDSRLAFGRDDTFGALRIELRTGGARLRFYSATGRVLDRSEVRCRPLSRGS